MTTSLVDADSLLALDIGSVNTRAILFDVVEGRYRFVAVGKAPTTGGAPYNDIAEGVRFAVDQLQTITGRTFIGVDGRLILPTQADGSGVDTCVATLSAGPPIKVVAIGLLEDISAQSAQNLAQTTYAQVADVMSLNDRRKTADRLDALLHIRPNLVIVAGGTENGASRSVLQMLESVGLAGYLLPSDQRPELLFVGNSELIKDVKSALGSIIHLHAAPNVRPTLEIEQLTPAQPYLAQVYRQVRSRQMRGVREIDLWAGERTLPTATAFGRTIRFISKEYAQTKKGVLGVDVGASATTIAAAFSGDLVLSVYTKLGLGESLPGLLEAGTLDGIARWLSVDISSDYLRDYIFNKSLYPASLPTTQEELAVEQALAIQAMYLAIKDATQKFPSQIPKSIPGLLPWFEPIVASGSVLTNAPTRGQSLLMILNALQPTGVTTVALDRNNLAPALGAAADINPLLTVQSLDAANFHNLCTVISPLGSAPHGTPVLRVRVTYADGSQTNIEVKFGTLETIQLPVGQSAGLHLQPLHRFDVGMGGPGHSGSVKVIGGSLGVVIDARGRPLRLPADPVRRSDMHKRWLWTLGG
jgi:hypothetical protein